MLFNLLFFSLLLRNLSHHVIEVKYMLNCPPPPFQFSGILSVLLMSLLLFQEAVDQGTDLAYDNFTRSDNVPQQQEQTMYPERPGEPECSYYMRHGSCKFQMRCKYHHPRDQLSKKPVCNVHQI